HLRLFGDVPEAPLDKRGDEAAREVDGFVRREPFPMQRRGSDLGMAIHKGLEFLERKDASGVQAFFLLTDGRHQVFPDMRSPYSADVDADPDWQELYRRGQALARRRTVFVYGFGLGERTDIQLLRRVFPARSVELVPGNPGGVAHALRGMRERLRREQLRQAVAQELREGKVEAHLAEASVSGYLTRFEVGLTVRNTYRHLSVRLEQVKGQATGAASQAMECGLVGVPSPVTLEPGKHVGGRVRGTLQAVGRRWRLGVEEMRCQGQFTVTPVAVFAQAAALRELGFSSRVTVRPATLTMDVTARWGVPLWIAIGLVLALIADFVGILRLRSYQPTQSLVGQLTRSGDRVETVDLSRFDRTEVTVGPGQDIDVSVRAAPLDNIVAVLRMEEEGDLASLTLDSRHASVQVNGQMLTGPRRLEAGSRIQIEQAQFTVIGETSVQVRFTRPTFLVIALLITVALLVMTLTVNS
ncbi:MAG: hypothetical protein NZT92_16660, partial [Abditibacteriales bacterium]|nr:hypothetical protein [Abditibacteriales bacterium]MDW8367243.1 hypothetical protein [Abditibacteriales bacterium]